MLPRALLATALPLLLSSAVAHAESAPLPPPTPAVDLLVVVDSSPTMAEERAALAARLGSFIDLLYQRFDASPGYGLSLHVGFITSDLGAGTATGYPGCAPGGDEGRLRAVASAGCQGPTGSYLRAEVNEWGETSYNFDGDLADAVACITPVALDGCVFQQPLRAAITALDGSNPGNVGFVRPDAVLAVLFVSNQDDCSADAAFYDADDTVLGHPSPYRCAQRGWSCTQPLTGAPQPHGTCVARDDSPHFEAPAEIVEALEALKFDPRKVVVGALRGAPSPVQTIAGTVLSPTCVGDTGIRATPALRLDAVAAGFAERGVTGDLCGGGGWLFDELATVIRTASDGGDDGGGYVRDAGPERDGGDWPNFYDGGSDEVGVSGHNMGCGCAAQGGGRGHAGGALVLVLAALGLRRRRR